MSDNLLLLAPVGLMPVLLFLVFLVWMDSYKLVALRAVVGTIIAGALTAALAYLLNGELRDWSGRLRFW